MSIQSIGLATSFQEQLRALFQMTKPTISLLVIVTMVPSMLISSPGKLDLSVAFFALLGTFLASGSAGIFNQLVDSDIDEIMDRTKKRPLPSGRVDTPLVWLTAISMALLSFFILWKFATPLAALLALAANAFYVFVYTIYLKRRTVQNIVIGGAAGSVGPMIGAAAVSGQIDLASVLLFAIIFLWTPPHFWALAIKYRHDYARAGVPMLPSVKGVAPTVWQILLYTIILLPCVVGIFLIGAGSWLYLVPSILLTGYFIYLAFKLWRSKEEKQAMPLFIYSCFYLFGIFGFLTIDKMLLI